MNEHANPASDSQYRNDISKAQEITRHQRVFRNISKGNYASSKDKAKARIVSKKIEQLQQYYDRLKLEITVATGTANTKILDSQLAQIEHEVRCQEQLQLKIDETLQQINHLRMQNTRLDRELFNLSVKSINDNMMAENLRKARLDRETYENKLNVSRIKEGEMIADNLQLRETIEGMLHDRKQFNKLWHQLIVQLSHDKTFLIDTVEHAIHAFKKGAELCVRIEGLNEKMDQDKKTQICDMIEMIRRIDADQIRHNFLGMKGQTRKLADLEGREYRRRQMFRDDHTERLQIDETVINKVKEFTGLANILKIIERFQKQENVYFSHYNYINELNNHIGTLNDLQLHLRADIDELRSWNEKKDISDDDMLQQLTATLKLEKSKTADQQNECADIDKRILALFRDVDGIFRTLRGDDSVLLKFLGDHSKVTAFNVHKFLAVLEKRLNSVLSFVYASERANTNFTGPYTVSGVERRTDDPTSIREIVRVQQCAECAEGEEVNRYDEEIVFPLEKEEIREKVKEKMKAPELQYRMHNISKCRLPRSWNIVSKRYQD